MVWEDGTTYEGEFVKGRFEGYVVLANSFFFVIVLFNANAVIIYVTFLFFFFFFSFRHGSMFYPENVNNPVQKLYEGEWSEGKMNGYGHMRY